MACICIALDNVTGYGVVSDYAIAFANVYAIGMSAIKFTPIFTFAYGNIYEILFQTCTHGTV